MKKKTIIITTVFILMSLLGILLKDVFIGKEETPPIEDRITSTLVKAAPSLLVEGEPAIQVQSVSQIDTDWYIASIISKHSNKKAASVTFILVDDGIDLHIIAGPDTHFSEAELLSLNIPDSVILELRKT